SEQPGLVRLFLPALRVPVRVPGVPVRWPPAVCLRPYLLQEKPLHPPSAPDRCSPANPDTAPDVSRSAGSWSRTLNAPIRLPRPSADVPNARRRAPHQATSVTASIPESAPRGPPPPWVRVKAGPDQRSVTSVCRKRPAPAQQGPKLPAPTAERGGPSFQL